MNHLCKTGFSHKLAVSLQLICIATPLVVQSSPRSSPALEMLLPNPVVARGKGFEIKKLELEDRVQAYISALAIEGQTVGASQRPLLLQSFLDRMILAAILKQRATAEDKEKAAEEAKRIIQDAKGRAGSEEAYRRQLLALGLKPEEFEQRAFEQALVETVIERELGSKVSVSEEEIRQFYDQGIDVKIQKAIEELSSRPEAEKERIEQEIEKLKKTNLEQLQRPLLLKAHLIVFYTISRLTQQPLPNNVQLEKLDLANKVLKMLNDGADFEQIATSYSEDPEVQKTKGTYLISQQTIMPDELKKALLFASTNQWQIVRTPIAVYVCRVVERIPPGKIPYEAARERIRQLLMKQKIEALLPSHLEQLKRDYGVVIIKEALE